MTLEQIQHAVNLISAADLSKFNENSINTSRNLLNVVGALEVLARNLQEHDYKSTNDVFDVLSVEEKDGDPDPTDVSFP